MEKIIQYEIELESILKKYEILGKEEEKNKGGEVEMDKVEKTQIVKDLEKLIKEFRSYKRLKQNKSLTKNQEGYMHSLLGTLQRKIGTYKELIVGLTGNQWMKEMNDTYDFWTEALRSGGFKPRIYVSIDACIQTINEVIGKLEKTPLVELEPQKNNVVLFPKAFIAHGGETPALDKLKKYLIALGVEPLIVEEQPSENRSILENINYYARQSDFAIILATKGDIDGKTGGFIPRGNVLIEIGKAQELFPDRTIYLKQAGVKFPSIISDKVGIRFVPQSMDDSFIQIAKEIRIYGILKAFKPPK